MVKKQLPYRDEITRMNRETFAREKQEGKHWTIPWLDLDVEAYRRYREGAMETLPEPYCDDPADRSVMAGVSGKKVLCLAGGGGQQSAVFSLLGAQVTVLDLTPEQLEGDQQAADHYGYPITLVQGDMRDLSDLPGARFDLVYQPISTLYVPDLREVYAGVRRILIPGGLYFSQYAFPFIGLAHERGWDGSGYLLHVSEPYRGGALRETPDGVIGFTRGELIGEFHHLLSDILNGLIGCGFVICGVWEDPRPEAKVDISTLEPGKEPHKNLFIPYGLSVVARLNG